MEWEFPGGGEIRKQAAGTEELEGPALFLTHRQIMGLQTDKDRGCAGRFRTCLGVANMNFS